jgi:antitoxin PrlF
MKLATSRLTTKSQTVLPKQVRAALDLAPGDLVGYRIEGAKVSLVKLRPAGETDDPFAAFEEWHGAHDDKAYRTL